MVFASSFAATTSSAAWRAPRRSGAARSLGRSPASIVGLGRIAAENALLDFTTLRCKFGSKVACVGTPPQMEVERNYKPPPRGEYLYKLNSRWMSRWGRVCLSCSAVELVGIPCHIYFHMYKLHVYSTTLYKRVSLFGVVFWMPCAHAIVRLEVDIKVDRRMVFACPLAECTHPREEPMLLCCSSCSAVMF